MIEGKTLPRRPVGDDEGDEEDGSFLGSFLRNFMVVNGLIFIGCVFLPGMRSTAGATASSRTDPRTNRPLLMEMQGCRVVNSEQDTGKPRMARMARSDTER